MHKHILIVLILSWKLCTYGTDYFVHAALGDDTANGQSRIQAFKTLARASQVRYQPGDRLLFASGITYQGTLQLRDIQGTPAHPIEIGSINWEAKDTLTPALIDFKGKANGISLSGCSYIRVSTLSLTGNGYYGKEAQTDRMRCGILVEQGDNKPVRGIYLVNLHIFDVYFENQGFTRGEKEVRTANGTQRYGWGIRIFNRNPASAMEQILVSHCRIEQVAHTGIKLTGTQRNIRQVEIEHNTVYKTGGPGIQMSNVQEAYVRHNRVSHSGNKDDSRKWGRGSGLWTWGCARVLIEKNSFLHANGPGDSAGAHIDFNCEHVILQYNLSAYNAGGFCEVLGNTYNCAYRYNVSINDGYRQKGVNGAFQEGKIFWLSGYQGKGKKRKGPQNFYFYNNTIYCDSALVAKIAIDKTSKGILIANNLFCLRGGAKAVLGDQYKPDKESDKSIEQVFFRHNVYLETGSWPEEVVIQDQAPIYDKLRFVNPGGEQLKDYILHYGKVKKLKGVKVKTLPMDKAGLWQTMAVREDILGHRVGRRPGIGAINVYRKN